MSKEFKTWLVDAGVEFEDLDTDERIRYKVLYDNYRDSKVGAPKLVEVLASAIVNEFEKRNHISIDASDAPDIWYSDIFAIAPWGGPCSIHKSLQADYMTFSQALDGSLDLFFSRLNNAPSGEEEFVQSAFEPLLESINSSSYIEFEGHCCFKRGRPIHTCIEKYRLNGAERLCDVRGQPDGTIVWNEVGVMTTELKSQSLSFLDDHKHITTEFKRACVQLAIYLKAEITTMFSVASSVPAQVFGLLTTGRHWALIEALPVIELSGLSVSWRHTHVLEVDPANVSVEAKTSVLRYLFMCAHNASAVVQFMSEKQLERNLRSVSLSATDRSDRGGFRGSLGGRRDSGGQGDTGGKGGKGDTGTKTAGASSRNAAKGGRGAGGTGRGNPKTRCNFGPSSRQSDTSPSVTLSSKALETLNRNLQRRGLGRDAPSVMEQLLGPYMKREQVLTVSAEELFEGDE